MCMEIDTMFFVLMEFLAILPFWLAPQRASE